MTAKTTKGSSNYVWEISQSLGHGATSIVYLGRSKQTFETVAVKVFNAASYGRPISIQMREFEVMKKLNHKNVVKLLSIEEENHTYNKVIVMEYCPYGSLFSMLEEAENAFGLPEDEVLLVLQHVANGMKHLRDNTVVHRDVKPGNILRCKDRDGRSVYKLTDFGAARELEDEEHFVSLYGTEEYLHPHVYEKAVLRRATSKSFDASVDLWSIGVTYYHMAAGCLPFKPYGGRRNKEIMHAIVSQKESGVISGVQDTEHGPIKWNQNLPGTCQLSSGLKKHMEPLLAALLEIDTDKIWPFETYFQAVDKICSNSVIHAFCPNICKSIKIYIDTEESLTSISEHVATETDIKEEDQLIIFDNRQLETMVDLVLTVKDYPDHITSDNPIFIFCNTEEFHSYPDPVYIAPFQQFSESNLCNYEMDYRVGRQCCKIGQAVLVAITTIIQQNLLLHSSVKQYSNELLQGLETQDVKLNYIEQFCNTSSIWFSNFLKIVKLQLASLYILQKNYSSPNLQQLMSNVNDLYNDASVEFNLISTKVKELLDEVCTRSEKLTKSTIQGKQLMIDWNFHDGCLPADRCCEYINESITKIKESTNTLRVNRSKRGLAHNDEQVHKYERSMIKKITDEIRIRLTTHCCPRAHSLYQVYQLWYRKALGSRKESIEIKEKMDVLIEKQTFFYKNFHEYMGKFINLLEDNLATVQSECMNVEITDSKVNKPDSSLEMRRQVAGDILHGLKSSRSSVEEMVLLVKENNSIIERFESLSSTDEWSPIT